LLGYLRETGTSRRLRSDYMAFDKHNEIHNPPSTKKWRNEMQPPNRESADTGHSAPVFRTELVPWFEPPGHFGGLSKALVSPDSHETAYFDFRISRYPIGSRVDPHHHDVAEHVYYFLSGTGLVGWAETTYIIEPGMVVFVPPGVVHSITNTGECDLVFVVATSPPSDTSRESRSR
jgi:mannose-6-phosphate isomerase-like protein (cupin superfamily)